MTSVNSAKQKSVIGKQTVSLKFQKHRNCEKKNSNQTKLVWNKFEIFTLCNGRQLINLKRKNLVINMEEKKSGKIVLLNYFRFLKFVCFYVYTYISLLLLYHYWKKKSNL